MTDPIETAICAAMGYHEADWLERACRIIEQHMRRRTIPGVKAYELDTIGGRVKCARECLGMNQTQLAKRVDMHLNAIIQIENGRGRLPAIKIPGMAITLHVSRPWLLCLSDEGGPEVKYNIRAPKRIQHRAREGIIEARARNAARKRTG